MGLEFTDTAAAAPTDPPFHEWVFRDGTLWTSFYRTGEGYLLRFPGLAEFGLDRRGERIRVWPVPGVSDETIEHLYLNQVLPLAWSRQGKLVLHGSAVEIGDVGVAFIGRSGLGKSTLAASFASAGFRLLSDDGLVFDDAGPLCRVMPNHPSIRLWQDSQDALFGTRVEAAPSLPFTSKARLLAGSAIGFCDQPRTLQRVFFLGDGTAPAPVISRKKASEALVELVKNSFLLDTEARDLLSSQFDALSRLASQPIYFGLDYPRHFDALPEVREAIARHVALEAG